MMRLWILMLCVCVCTASIGQNLKRKPRKRKPITVNSLINIHYECEVVPKQEPNIHHLLHGLGDLCVGWVKCIDHIPPEERKASLPPGFVVHRAMACKAVQGKCPELEDCAFSAIEDTVAKIIPDYVRIPDTDKKFRDAKGRTIEFDLESQFESQTAIGKYNEGSYAALYEKYPPPDGDFSFCAMPLKITGENTGADRIPGVVTCPATISEGKLTCPTVKACVEKRMTSEAVVARTSPTKIPNTELSIRTDGAPRRGNSEQTTH